MQKTASLPLPSPDALAQSSALVRQIHAAIDAAGGWLPFSRFMELALYTPGMGYYSGGAAKFGRAVADGGDFITAPELSPLFGRTIARQLAEAMAHGLDRIVEFGAGTGRLAATILDELDALGMPCREYAIVELSGELRERQRDALAAHAGKVVWLDVLPERIDGIVIGNEVLDAMPVRLWQRRNGAWLERGIIKSGDGFAWESRVAATLPAVLAQVPGAHDFDTETHEAAQAFVASVAERLAHGLLLLIDYGFPAGEYYHPQRDHGTLMCHYRQHAHGDPLYLPGLQDITAHVDFSGIAECAVAQGLELAGYANQARFLMNGGLMDLLMELDPADAATFLPASNAAQRLLSEAEMGELFKVIALTRGMDALDLSGFARGDRTHRLLGDN